MLDLPLERLQRWMQAVVVHPGSLDEALAAPDAVSDVPAERLGDVLLPSSRLSAAERLGVYHGMYPLRMYEALAFDYPALEHFLGEAGFQRLVRDYVAAFPSRSYTLNRLGDHLPEFLATASVPRREFCRELAQLELAVTQVFDAPEAASLDEATVAAVPEAAWEGARLRPVEALRLLSFRYPVNAYAESVRGDDHDHPPARRKDTWVAVYRRDYAVYRLDLSRPAHDLLRDLVAGLPLGQALAAAVARGGRPKPQPDLLFGWFRQWVAGGVFQAIETN